MKTRITNIVFIALILLAVFSAIYFYPSLPDQMASHWGIDGNVNGYTTKFLGAYLLPIVLTVLFLFYYFIPKIDPLKSNIESFRRYYNSFWIFIAVFLAYINALSLAWNLGYRFDFTAFMIPALSVVQTKKRI